MEKNPKQPDQPEDEGTEPVPEDEGSEEQGA